MSKKNYLTTIHKYINHMSPNQLNILYNLHSDLFVKSKKIRIPATYYNKGLKHLTYYKIKNYTPKSQYINIINIIHLIFSNYYNYDQIYTILLDLI